MKICHNGHPQTPANVSVSQKGYTRCKVCTRERAREKYDRECRALDAYAHRVEHPGSRT